MSDEALLLVATVTIEPSIYASATRCQGRGCRHTLEPGETVRQVAHDDGHRVTEHAWLCDRCYERIAYRCRPARPSPMPPPLLPGQEPQPSW